jgi:hypothetical protein
MGRAWQRTAVGAGAICLLLALVFATSAAAASGGAGAKRNDLRTDAAAMNSFAGTQLAGTDPTQLTMRMTAKRFVVRHGKVYARGPLVAKAAQSDGTAQVVRQRVRLRVATTRRCRILSLHLAPVYLNLLGLQVRTSAINLRITGDRRQVLGRLFCSLSRGINLSRHRLARRTAHSLNRRLDSRPLRLMAFKAPVYPHQQTTSTSSSEGTAKAIPPVPPGSCEVLDLLLGPLHLNLLGLVVDLYGPTRSDPVEVLVTADPNGGLLGSLLCQATSP